MNTSPDAPSADVTHGPLTGVRVIDLSRVLAGPFCSMQLGDMGADVVKIERPDGGDDTRRFGPPFVEGVSTYYLAVNRNKRSLTLDLKHPDGKAVLWDLIASADVLLENFRPGTLEKLGFSYEACLRHNPRLVYCSISAYGHEGDPDWTRRPGYDVVLQGMGGIPSLTGPPDGAPSKVGAPIADLVSGSTALQGILLALLARARTGRGQRVDTSMFDGQVSYLVYLATAWLNAGQRPPRMGNRHLSIAPYSTYAAADGWLNIAVANERLWARFCAGLERPDLFEDPRFATNALRVENVDALEGAFASTLKGRTVADWVALFDEAGIPAGPVQTLDQVLTHPQLTARGMIASVTHPVAGTVKMAGIAHRLSETPGAVREAPPTLGQHTDALLAELGYDADRVAALRAEGVV